VRNRFGLLVADTALVLHGEGQRASQMMSEDPRILLHEVRCKAHVTLQCSWGAEEVRALKGASGGGAMLAAAVEPLLLRDRAFVPHDAVAAVAVLEPSLFEWVARDVRCETTGVLTRGETVVDRRPWTAGGQTLVAEAVKSEKVNELILEALAGLPR